MKAKDPRGDLGKWAESEAGKWLQAQSDAQFDFAFHRLPDTRAARGMISAQPADFIVANGSAYGGRYLEVKETANPTRLPRDKVPQLPLLQKFWWAGTRFDVVVYRSTYDDWVIFKPNELCPPGVDAPKSFPFGDRPSYPTAAAALQKVFFE